MTRARNLMSAKTVLTGALAAGLLSLGMAMAQAPEGGGYEQMPPPRAATPPGAAEAATPVAQQAPRYPGPSPWIVYHRDCCWGEMSGTPILSELYVRAGANFPLGGDIMGRLLSTGWTIGGGARALFFNPTGDAAWTLDAGITNTRNHGDRPDVEIPLSIIVPGLGGVPQRVNFGQGGIPGVTVRDYNRTTVNLSFGKECYLWGDVNAACCGERNWRWGWDLGGRYGTAKADFHEIRHRTDVIGGIFLAVHSDFEIPCECCVFFAGLRLEWGYTWGDILQQTSDVHDLGLLLNLGVRF
jgi:hypothetical protein